MTTYTLEHNIENSVDIGGNDYTRSMSNPMGRIKGVCSYYPQGTPDHAKGTTDHITLGETASDGEFHLTYYSRNQVIYFQCQLTDSSDPGSIRVDPVHRGGAAATAADIAWARIVGPALFIPKPLLKRKQSTGTKEVIAAKKIFERSINAIGNQAKRK